MQTFAHVVLALGGDAYRYALRDRTTQGVIDDVASGKSQLGVLFETSATADDVNAALDAAGLEFVELIQSAPRVALPKSHPMVNAESLTLEDMEDYPYLYFEQDEDSPVAFAEEALASVPRAKSIACTDRASLSELIVALNGYTVTSGILVGISDGAGLNTVPLDTDVQLRLGYVVRKGEEAGRDRPALRGHPQEEPGEVRTLLTHPMRPAPPRRGLLHVVIGLRGASSSSPSGACLGATGEVAGLRGVGVTPCSSAPHLVRTCSRRARSARAWLGRTWRGASSSTASACESAERMRMYSQTSSTNRMHITMR